MKAWVMVSEREWEYIDPDGLVLAVIEETSSGTWSWDGELISDFGVESSRNIAMDRVEELYSPTIH